MGAIEQLHALRGQARAPHAEEGEVRAAGLEGGDEFRGVGVTRRLTGHDENLGGGGHAARILAARPQRTRKLGKRPGSRALFPLMTERGGEGGVQGLMRGGRLCTLALP